MSKLIPPLVPSDVTNTHRGYVTFPKPEDGHRSWEVWADEVLYYAERARNLIERAAQEQRDFNKKYRNAAGNMKLSRAQWRALYFVRGRIDGRFDQQGGYEPKSGRIRASLYTMVKRKLVSLEWKHGYFLLPEGDIALTSYLEKHPEETFGT